jgi:hypothetical protein
MEALTGPNRDVIFRKDYRPHQTGLSDYHMDRLGITIGANRSTTGFITSGCGSRGLSVRILSYRARSRSIPRL